MAHYLADPICKIYYDEIKKAGSEARDVDNFYLNTFFSYFPGSQLYGTELESRHLKELNLDPKTFRIRCIRNIRPNAKKVVVIECQRQDKEPQNAVWRDTLDQAIKYVSLIHAEQNQNAEDPIHIITAIGSYFRAFTHNKGASDAAAFKLYPNQPLELSRDEQMIHEILMEMNRITHH